MASAALYSADVGTKKAFVSFPGADYTQTSAVRATEKVLARHGWQIEVGDGIGGCVGERDADDAQGAPVAPPGKDLYLADYDLLPFEELLPSSCSSTKGKQPQCSSYVIRKALIRKHYLASALNTYAVKLPPGPAAKRFRTCTPKTWHLEIQFADELDELLMDDLYDLAELLETNHSCIDQGRGDDVRWFILKPGMADRGNGIRIFSTLEQLQTIFEEFQPESDDEDEEEDDDGDEEGEKRAGTSSSFDQDGSGYAGKDTSVMASQLRHFVIQEYIRSPLLVDPVSSVDSNLQAAQASEKLNIGDRRGSNTRKFHLRAYVLCVAGLAVYLHDDMLALFAPLAYREPSEATVDELECHLTNTCLQEDGRLAVGNDARPKEENVFLWSDLGGSSFRDPGAKASDSPAQTLSPEMMEDVRCKAAEVIGASFEAAAKAGSIHWQMWPNAFEVFGVDLMVGYDDETDAKGRQLKVWLLEVNAQPDFAQTGARLSSVIERLFERVCEIAVLPYHSESRTAEGLDAWNVGESRLGTTLCFREDLGRGF
ncbi:hypothetical protein NDA11_006465 [Ustilago hordei]|uniref:Uncharacterized protein n=1 Tax=Ustilago hordei TaxID=120017 RepID=I2FYS7_USTHO|nr:uncharacterized protein UHO2_03836 [Ustilago hordei]KAJ1037488.1 hypothetical protein NDA10_001766 [Ustilago hordei]KAJ1579973.1 hypothetical protein NDA15_003734 [Ustilago hordei]KAJ1581777.1 hypothetical protein NDA12_001863 [Ustilago hordei]KAJ1582567.1 hypothetical protein NDA11_006465 [Ustilago hordei]KAJ1600309.1 hypothetical protein NDA14_005796 [Ustilago hordei]